MKKYHTIPGTTLLAMSTLVDVAAVVPKKTNTKLQRAFENGRGSRGKE